MSQNTDNPFRDSLIPLPLNQSSIEEACSITCSKCGLKHVFPPINKLDPPCSNCGSRERSVTLKVTDHVQILDCIHARAKDPKYPSKQKIRYDLISGADLQRSTGRYMEKVRLIDKDANRYFEKVTDPDTGQVLHECNEPLSEHRGHGSDKKET